MLPLLDVRGHAPDRVVRLAPQRALGRRSAPCSARRRSRRRRPSRTSDRRAATRARGSGSCPRGRSRSTRLPSRAARRTSRTAAARRRRTSAASSSGSTTLPFDFDMTSPSFSTMPCVSSCVNGSLVVDHAEIAEHAREEARVDQVQDRVLDAAAVEVHRHPVLRLRRIERQRRRSSDRRSGRSTTTNRRTCPSCRSRAARARRTSDTSRCTNSGTCASGESPRPVNSATFGSSTGSWSSGTGTMPSFSQ